MQNATPGKNVVKAESGSPESSRSRAPLPPPSPSVNNDPMSLLSSFIIDPVVRHARRFSGQRLGEASHDEARALTCDNTTSPSSTHHGQPRSDTATDAATPPDQQAPRSLAERPPFLTDRTRRHSSFQLPGCAVVEEHDENNGQQHNGIATSPDEPHPTNNSAEMPSNSSHGLPIRPRSTELSSNEAPSTSITNSSPWAGPLSEGLPADDGMAHLRMRIHEIRDMKVSDLDRARMMHGLMMERYNVMRPTSPSSFISQDRPVTPTSGQSIFSEIHASSPYSAASDIDPENPYNLREGDTTPTYRSIAQHGGHDHAEDEEDESAEGDLVFGCQHYQRNVKLQCFECRRWYTCRHCHDTVEGHSLNRKLTRNMLCMACGTPQPAAEFCTNCKLQAACYYCSICKLWDNNSKKKIYHCIDCGICRRGEGLGKDFHHCKVYHPIIPYVVYLTVLRNATFAYPYPTLHLIDVSHALLTRIVPYVATISSHRPLPSFQCHVGIIYTKNAIISTWRRHTNAQFARKVQ